MMPTTCDQAWLDRAQDLADADGVLPVVRTELLQAVDTLARVLDAAVLTIRPRVTDA